MTNPVFSTISFAQGVLVPLGTACVGLESYLVKNAELRSILVALTTAIFSQLAVSFRKPSTQGGTVAVAPTIQPGQPGDVAVLTTTPAMKQDSKP